MTITLEQQIACVRRELALRQRVYPKWVATSRMKQAEADKELAAMQAVHDTLAALAEKPAPTPTLPGDVVRLVLAARDVAFGDIRIGGRDDKAMQELDRASEAFADRVPWEDEPEDEEVDG